jgi:Tfp pilus assembly protein FimT
MKTTHLLRFAFAGLVVAAASSLSAAGMEELAAAIQQSRTETINTHNALVANLKALDALVTQKQGDLRPAFTAYTESLKETRAATERTLQRVSNFKTSGDAYFVSWQNEVQQIGDEGIRNRAIKRLEDTRASWNATSTALQGAAVQFPVLLGYLKDVETALTYDLTTDGVKSVRGAARSAAETFDMIRAHVQHGIAELDKMTAGMSSVVKG